MVVYEHTEASRPHIHMLLVGCSVSTDTLKNYIKKELGVISSRDWSFKTAKSDYDNYIKYMSKGYIEPCYNKGFEETYLTDCRLKWEVDRLANAANIHSANAVISSPRSRQSEYDLQIMIEDLLWPMNSRNDNGEIPAVSKEDILQATKKVLEREHKFAHYQRVARLCQAVRWRFHPAECDAIIFKMF